MTRWLDAPRGCAMAGVAVALLSFAGEARAGGKGQVVAVVVEGAHADQVAGWLEDRVTAPDTLREGDVFRDALRSKGAPPLRSAASSDARDVLLVALAHAAARDAGVDYVILVDVNKTPRATHVHVWHIDMQRSGPVVDSDVSLPPSASTIETTRAIVALAPRHATPAADPAPTPTPVVESPAPVSSRPPASVDLAPEADRATPTPAAGGPSSLLSLRAGLGVGTRHFSYVDRITPSLRPYDLGAAPLATVSAVVYPLATTQLPVVRDFGLTGDYGQAFGLASEDSAGARVGTTWRSFDVGATERIPLTRALLANVSAGYGGNDFQFTQSLAGGAAALPTVAYRFVRVGVDARYRLSAFSVYAGGGYLDILSSGYTAQLFPRESVGGVEGHLGASYSLAKNWEVSLSAEYTRMFFSFNPVPGDGSVAGGALDEQTRILAGFSYLM